MEMGPFLFTLVLLGVGVLLILLFRKGIRDQLLSQDRLASAAKIQRRPAPHARSRRTETVLSEEEKEFEGFNEKQVREAFDKFSPEDPWRSMTSAQVSEAFDEFTREP